MQTYNHAAQDHRSESGFKTLKPPSSSEEHQLYYYTEDSKLESRARRLNNA